MNFANIERRVRLFLASLGSVLDPNYSERTTIRALLRSHGGGPLRQSLFDAPSPVEGADKWRSHPAGGGLQERLP